MAACILAMLFIGVGMVSTIMPKYVPLLATHKTLGITILLLALSPSRRACPLWCAAFAPPICRGR